MIQVLGKKLGEARNGAQPAMSYTKGASAFHQNSAYPTQIGFKNSSNSFLKRSD